MTTALLERTSVSSRTLDEDDSQLRWRAVGAEIRAGREARSWSQEELARQVGIGQKVLSADERGPRYGVPRVRLEAYADLLDLDYDLLVRMAYGRQRDLPAAGSARRSA